MDVKVFVLLLGVGIVFGNKTRISYDGFKVFRLHPTSQDQNELLSKLEDEGNFDFWTEINYRNMPVDVMVQPGDQDDFMRLMAVNRIESEVLIDDVQKKIITTAPSLTRGKDISWTDYYKLDEIHAWMDTLELRYPDKVKVISGGISHEERELKGVKISFGPNRKSVFVEGGIHAREWISPATTTYIINELLTNEDPSFRSLAEGMDWYIIPSINPDGYVYSHEWDRMWRKNRSRHGFCYGVDVNRNWDYNWREQGTSSNPCSATFGGFRAFSESESYTLSKFLDSISSDLIAYIAFHSYSQFLLIPYADKEEHLDNYDELKTIGDQAAKALEMKHGSKYTVGTAPDILYAVSGSSVDWAKFNHKLPITYTYELRDRGENGFLLPPEQIIPNCEEVMESLIVIMKEMKVAGYV